LYPARLARSALAKFGPEIRRLTARADSGRYYCKLDRWWTSLTVPPTLLVAATELIQ
jgi:hypothetical protein